MKYIYSIGKEGSTFQRKTSFDIEGMEHPPHLDYLRRFLKRNPQIHDLSWSEDDGTDHIIKRKDEDGVTVPK
jgi:hypothetical protein